MSKMGATAVIIATIATRVTIVTAPIAQTNKITLALSIQRGAPSTSSAALNAASMAHDPKEKDGSVLHMGRAAMGIPTTVMAKRPGEGRRARTKDDTDDHHATLAILIIRKVVTGETMSARVTALSAINVHHNHTDMSETIARRAVRGSVGRARSGAIGIKTGKRIFHDDPPDQVLGGITRLWGVRATMSAIHAHNRRNLRVTTNALMATKNALSVKSMRRTARRASDQRSLALLAQCVRNTRQIESFGMK
jgi:hypothetical protein